MDKLLLDIKAESLSSFRLLDVSCYSDESNVTNGVLEVYTPSSIHGVLLRVQPKFEEIFNTSNLKVSDEFKYLPDGAYTLKYSVSPNAYVNSMFTYYRNNILESKIKEQIKALFDIKDEINNKDFVKKLTQLNEIKDYSYAAKLAAEETFDVRNANKYYREATLLLENYISQC